MANNLDIYDPLFYAQEGLIQLHKNLGLAGRVYRGYDKDAKAKGSTIEIKRPSTFSVQDAPSNPQDLLPSHITLVLNQWKEVKFKLTDKELTFTQEDIIRDHIQPAGYALADYIDQKLAALVAFVPWYFDEASPGTVAWSDLTGTKAVMRNNKVPLEDPGAMHFMVDGTTEAGLSNLAQWNNAATAGSSDNLMRGSLGTRLGFEFFANQNTPSHAANSIADAAGAINNASGYAAGATTIAFDGVTASVTFKAGDSFSIAGDTQRYVLTADVASDGTGAVAAAQISPPLAQAVADNAVVAFSIKSYVANLAFHRNAFVLAMAPLSEMAGQLRSGPDVASVYDPVTGLALRSRVYAMPDSSDVRVALDVLFAVSVLDGNLACLMRG